MKNNKNRLWWPVKGNKSAANEDFANKMTYVC